MTNANSHLQLPAPLILASQSPRRMSLLRQLGLVFTTIPAHIDEESVAANLPADEYAQILARSKAQQVAATQTTPCIVLGADTIVVLDNVILNKPRDVEEAQSMLRRLSNRTHDVITAICLIYDGNISVRQRTTRVQFRPLADEEIQAYVQSGSPMDKAGAYGIQDDYGAVFVRHIVGCYYNIVGLPLELLFEMLTQLRDNATAH